MAVINTIVDAGAAVRPATVAAVILGAVRSDHRLTTSCHTPDYRACILCHHADHRRF